MLTEKGVNPCAPRPRRCTLRSCELTKRSNWIQRSHLDIQVKYLGQTLPFTRHKPEKKINMGTGMYLKQNCVCRYHHVNILMGINNYSIIFNPSMHYSLCTSALFFFICTRLLDSDLDEQCFHTIFFVLKPFISVTVGNSPTAPGTLGSYQALDWARLAHAGINRTERNHIYHLIHNIIY